MICTTVFPSHYTEYHLPHGDPGGRAYTRGKSPLRWSDVRSNRSKSLWWVGLFSHQQGIVRISIYACHSMPCESSKYLSPSPQRK